VIDEVNLVLAARLFVFGLVCSLSNVTVHIAVYSLYSIVVETEMR
jgi:hypothetical protein